MRKSSRTGAQIQSIAAVLAEHEGVLLKSCPVILLPRLIASMVFAGEWQDLILLAKWTHLHFPSLYPEFDPQWLEESIGTFCKQPEPACLGADSVDLILAQFRRTANGELQPR